MAGDGCQGRAVLRRITGSVDSRVRHTLQKVIELHPSVLQLRPGGFQFEDIQARRTFRGVHHEVRVDRQAHRPMRGKHAKAGLCTLDPLDGGTGAHIDSQGLELRHQPFDHVGVGSLQHPRASLEHCHVSAGERRDVRKLGADVAAANQDDAPRQHVKSQKLLARDDVLFTGNIQLHRLGPYCDQEVLPFEGRAANLYGVICGESRSTVEHVDAVTLIKPFLCLRHSVREHALECHQGGPVDPRRADHTVGTHAPQVVHG